jgi:transcriptional regulator with XRE-family HTH domain
MKARVVEGFGQRLARFRKGKGLTQTELGELVHVSKRVIAYYETEGGQPPGAMLAELARHLDVTVDAPGQSHLNCQ